MDNLKKFGIPTLALGIAFSFLLLSGRAQSEAPPVQKESKQKVKVRSVPIVDFSSSVTEQLDWRRRQRNSRHDSPVSKEGQRRPELNENMPSELLDLPITHQPREAALPVGSDLIVIGRISQARAFLSNDRTGVYSEVTMVIEEILKASPGTPLSNNISITAERDGGGVRFGSGKVVRRGQLGRDIPEPEGRYLLFLNATPEPDNFSIVTGYEITDGTVTPLDSAPGINQFAGYESFRNSSETYLLESLRKALKPSTLAGGL